MNTNQDELKRLVADADRYEEELNRILGQMRELSDLPILVSREELEERLTPVAGAELPNYAVRA